MSRRNQRPLEDILGEAYPRVKGAPLEVLKIVDTVAQALKKDDVASPRAYARRMVDKLDIAATGRVYDYFEAQGYAECRPGSGKPFDRWARQDQADRIFECAIAASKRPRKKVEA